MDDTLVGVHINHTSWWQRLTARLRTRSAPSRPPAWHAPRGPANTRPGGRHRRSDGGDHETYQLPDGRVITFRRRP